MAETPSSYKRFAQSDKISQGTTNAALSLNDYLPGQHVTGPNNNDIAATLAQVQAIPIGTATLSGNTYNVTISNYPNTATIYPGQKISVKFKADAPTADDTALNLSAFGQSLPLCARGVRMGQGAIKSGMILELVYRGDMWNADYDVVKANRGNDGYTTFADGQSGYNKNQVDNALADQLNVYKNIISSEENGPATFKYVKQGKMICGRLYFSPKSTSVTIFSSVKIPIPSVQCVFRVRNNNTGDIHDVFLGDNGSVSCAFSPIVGTSYSGIFCYVID